MKVREIMTIEVATAQPDSTLEEVASMMKAEDAGAIPVLDEDELVGIITDRDIVVRCIAEGRDATETNVEDILTEDLTTIEPDADVEEAARLMSERQIRRLPVVEDGMLVGVVSLGDIAIKEMDEQPASAALEGVSRGVKQERGRPAGEPGRGKSGKTQSASLAEEEEVEEEISEYSGPGRREDRRAQDRRGRELRLANAQTGQSRSGRATSNLRGRASSGGPAGKTRFGASQEQPRKGAQSTGGRQQTGISNRNLAQENSRQKKVTSARRETKASGRRRAS